MINWGVAGNTITYIYDALDRPVEETESHGTSSSRTTLLSYVGLTKNVSEEQHKSGTTLTTTKTYRICVYPTLAPWRG